MIIGMLPKEKANVDKESTGEEVEMPSKTTPPQMKRLLVINPNTSQSMTDGLESLIDGLGMYIFELEILNVYRIISGVLTYIRSIPSLPNRDIYSQIRTREY